MGDHDPCPKCGYENARCACVKAPKRKRTKAEKKALRALVDDIREAVERRRDS